MKENLKTTYQSMNLKYENLAFYHEDRFSQICYKELQSKDLEDIDLPILGIYTRKNANEKWGFKGIISYIYNFVGNELIVNRIENTIESIGTPIYDRHIILNSKLTKMFADIVIRNSNNIPSIGDIYPVINIVNSYDGSSISEISFGIEMLEGNNRNSITFRNNLGSYRQIHLQNSKTSLVYEIGNYIEVLQTNIVDLVNLNLNKTINEAELLSSLDLIERVGKRKRELVSSYLKQISEGRNITSWDLFLAITRFSTLEKNLNAKVLMENIVERILEIPTKMIQSFPILSKNKIY